MTFLHHFSFSKTKPFAKNFVNAIFWVFVIFSVYLLFLANEKFWEYPRFQGVISFLSAFVIVLPFLVYRATRLHEKYHEHFVYASEFLIAFPLSLNGLGAVLFFDASWGFDSLMHFLNSVLAVFLIFLVLGAFWKRDTTTTRTVFFFIAVAGSFVLGALMEGWERFSDIVFQTRTWGEVGQHPLYDTAIDFFYDALGAAFGALILFFWGRQWLSELRRVSPKIQKMAFDMKDRVEDHMREQLSAGKEKLQAMKAKGIVRIDKTKERLRRRSRKIVHLKGIIS